MEIYCPTLHVRLILKHENETSMIQFYFEVCNVIVCIAYDQINKIQNQFQVEFIYHKRWKINSNEIVKILFLQQKEIVK